MNIEARPRAIEGRAAGESEEEVGGRESQFWEAVGRGRWLAEAWKDGLRRVLESMGAARSGEEPEEDIQFEVGASEAENSSVWVSPTECLFTLEGVPGAALWAGAPSITVAALGEMISGCASLNESDLRDAFLDLMKQTAPAAGEILSGRLRRRISFSPGQIAGLPAQPGCSFQITFSCKNSPHAIGLALSPELLEYLDSPTETGLSAAPRSHSPATEGEHQGAGGILPRNLDLLMEVELPVCVTFGRTQLPLKDVLKLSSGSIVELNRLANEPVEVLINNYVIARGEVVVVDGNYGIRVTEIVSRQERIRSIF